jgi:eukaryotic-like serine/threonine-protein kinase
MAPYDDYDPRPPRQGHPVLAAFITSLVTTALAFAALTVADRRGLLEFLHEGSHVEEVPSIVGVSVEQARELLRARNLLLKLQSERPDARVAAGQIAGQVPLAGSRAVQGTSVEAFVSSGPLTMTVPALAGTRPEDAAEQLRGRKLLLGPRREEASATVAAGLVVGTEPAAGQTVSPEVAITLVVSTGPAAKPIPKLLGMRLSRARKALEDAGFKLGNTRYGSSDDYDGEVVIKQEPAASAPAAPGSAVNVVVND